MFRARHRPRHVKGQKNRLEAAYEKEVLQAEKADGKVVGWYFEEWTCTVALPNVAKPARLTVDYLVLMADGSIEMRDVKGFLEDDALVKFKAASERFPWLRWFLVSKATKRDGGAWKSREI